MKFGSCAHYAGWPLRDDEKIAESLGRSYETAIQGEPSVCIPVCSCRWVPALVLVPRVVKKTRTPSGNNQVPQFKTSDNNSGHNERNRKN